MANNQEVIAQARQMASGYLGGMMNEKRFDRIDRMRDAWVAFVEASDTDYRNWQHAWNDFKRRGYPGGLEEDRQDE